MFNNIGAKIKGVAKLLFWVGVIFSVLIGFLVATRSIEYNYFYSYNNIVSIILGIFILVFGIGLSWLETFLLYGFGELIDSNQKILKHLENSGK